MKFACVLMLASECDPSFSRVELYSRVIFGSVD